MFNEQELYFDLMTMEPIGVEEQHSRKLRKWSLTLIILILTLIGVAVVAISIGPTQISAENIMGALFSNDLLKVIAGGHASSSINAVVLEIRLPRILIAGLVGASLAVAGTAMQGIFRNPMASPYILGLSSGAAFGASLAIVLGFSLISGEFAVPAMAFLFCFITLFIVYAISRTKMGIPVTTLLLAGIAVGSLFNALVSLMMYFDGESLSSIVYWMMGGLWTSNWNQVWVTLPLIGIGSIALLFYSSELNLMMVGEEHATNLGVNVKRCRLVILVLSSLVTAAAVSVSGIIGFVGLIVPHTLRIILGPDNRILMPASLLFGAIFMISMDTIARTILSPAELPVGIITALLGAPFFLYLLRSRKHDIWGW
jgi:iron complex transport system permease protein